VLHNLLVNGLKNKSRATQLFKIFLLLWKQKAHHHKHKITLMEKCVFYSMLFKEEKIIFINILIISYFHKYGDNYY